MDKKIIAIITARGGSKGIPGKNIKLLAGKPLIAYSIEEAKKSKHIDRIVTTTDDKEIAEVAKKYGSEIVDRPEELAQDDSPTPPALRHVLETLEKEENYRPDLVLLLQPTTPLRTVKHIDEMVEKFFQGDYDSMISVTFIHEPRFDMIDDNYIEQVEKNRPQRQERQATIFESGALYLTDVSLIKKEKVVGDKIGYYKMDKNDSIDIDEPFDFIVAEQLILNRK